MIDLRDIDGASSLVVELFPDLTKRQVEIALRVVIRGCHSGYGTAWVPLGKVLIDSLQGMRAAGPTAGGYSFGLLLAGANDAVEEYTATVREALIEHDLQWARREDTVPDKKKLLSSALELMKKALEE
jgi:hypothetical protein